MNIKKYDTGEFMGNYYVYENGRVIACCTRAYDAAKIHAALGSREEQKMREKKRFGIITFSGGGENKKYESREK
jgi:hypothetical protein